MSLSRASPVIGALRSRCRCGEKQEILRFHSTRIFCELRLRNPSLAAHSPPKSLPPRFSSSLIIPTMPPRRPRTRAVKSSAPSPSPTVESRSSSRKGSKKASEEIVEEENEEEEVGDGVEAVAQGVEEEHEDAVEAESEVVEVEDGDTEDGTGGADGGDVEGDVEGGDTEIAESSKMSMADRLAKLKHLRIRMVCPPSILILSSVSPRVVG